MDLDCVGKHTRAKTRGGSLLFRVDNNDGYTEISVHLFLVSHPTRIIDCSEALSTQMKCKISRRAEWLWDGWEAKKKKTEMWSRRKKRATAFLLLQLRPIFRSLESNFKVLDCIWFIFTRKIFIFLSLEQPKDGSYDDGKLIIVTDSQILAIPLHRCNSEKINSCRYELPLNYPPSRQF